MTTPRPPGLALGTAARTERAALKRRIEGGRVDVPSLLEGSAAQADEETALSMPIKALLAAVPGIGMRNADKIMLSHVLAGGTRLRELTVRARRDLARTIRKETP